MRDPAVTIMGLIEEELLRYFDPDPPAPYAAPIGGGTTLVWKLAGDQTGVTPPPWVGPDDTLVGQCSPYLWMRLAGRWRQGQSVQTTPAAVMVPSCSRPRGVTVEVGIGRCHPLDIDTPPEVMEQHAHVQWDDSWRIDNALCQAMRRAEELEVVTETGVGPGEPIGPEGLVLTWTQSAYAQL